MTSSYVAWCKQDHVLIRLKQETDMAASKRGQVMQELEAATAELASATHELQSKQSLACSLDQKLADSEHELRILQQSVHALHAEHATAQRAHAQDQSQLAEAEAQRHGALSGLSSQTGEQHRAVSNGKDFSPTEKACTVTQTDTHNEDPIEIAAAGHDRKEDGAAVSRSFADDQERAPQVSLPCCSLVQGAALYLVSAKLCGHHLHACCMTNAPCLLHDCILLLMCKTATVSI